MKRVFRAFLFALLACSLLSGGDAYGTSTITLRTTRSGSYGGYYCLFAYPESCFWRIYGGHSGGGVYTYTVDR